VCVCVQELEALIARLFTGENRDLRIASITFGVLRGSVTNAQKTAFRIALESLQEHIEEAAACVEAGDQNFRLHVQCMLYLRISRAESAADDMKTYLLKKMNESEVGNVRLCVRVRDPGGEVTVERQIGYCAKDYGKRHFQTVYLKNITHDVLRARGAAYAQVRGHNMFHRKTELKPYALWGTLSRWEHGNLYPMNRIMNHYQIVRFMLLTDRYVLSGAWIVPMSGRMSGRAAEAWRRIYHRWRMFREVDIWDVVCVLAKNEYAPGTEAYEIMRDRHSKFDDMSLDMAKRVSRRALQLLEPHLQDGVVVGNIDVDEMLAQQLDADPDDVDPLLEDTDMESVDMAVGNQVQENAIEPRDEREDEREGDEDAADGDTGMHPRDRRSEFFH
jgi:hypothetical protein